MKVELRPDGAGHFDELVAENVGTLHFEMMDDKCLWIGITSKNGKVDWRMTVSARTKLTVTAEED